MKKIFNKISGLFSLIKSLNLKTIYLIAIIGFFIGGNILLSPLVFRVDLSQGQAYSLSSSTKKIIKDLKKPLTIKFFVSSDLPTRFIPLKNDVIDFLNEYQRASNKIKVEILDPKKDTKTQEEAQTQGIPELQFSQLEQDKYEIKAVYFGLLITYENKKEIIPQATDLESLEYNLTASIYKLIKERSEKIAIIGKKEDFFSQDDDLQTFKKTLRQQYEVDFLNIDAESTVDKISSDYKAILVFDDGEKEYQKEEITKINQYLENKGRAIFFVNGVWVDKNLSTSTANHQLFNLLKDWGVVLNQDLILSTSGEMVNFGNQEVQFLTLYPYWLRTNVFNKNKTLFSNINQLTFPWVSSLEKVKNNNINFEVLVKSTNQSWSVKDSSTSAIILNPQAIPEPDPKSFRAFNLVVQTSKKNSGQVVVVGSSRFVLENFLTRTSDNLKFILNLLNELASGGALSGIHQRSVKFYSLPQMPEGQKDLVKYLNILFLPIVFALYGVYRLIKRNRKIIS